MKLRCFSRREFLEMASSGAVFGASPGLGTPAMAKAPARPDTYAGGGETAPGLGDTGIFPPPQQVEKKAGGLALDTSTIIVLPANPTPHDRKLARLLTQDLSDFHQLQLRVQGGHEPSPSPAILMGTIQNSAVLQACERAGIAVPAAGSGPAWPEGYVLDVNERGILIAGSDEAGAWYGLQSLRQMLAAHGLRIPSVTIHDWPDKPFRGIKVYLPGRANVEFFRRFVRDFAAYYKFNKLMVEMNACMRLDRHPELNVGWEEFSRDVNYSRQNYPRGPLHGREQNSSHQDCGDGSFIEKDEVAGLVNWVEENGLEFVPEIPSLTHSFYLLAKHKDLSDFPGDAWPDTYCPSNPATYQLLFEVMDEYLEVTQPKMVHTGHDEWFAPFGLCPRCKGKQYGEVYAGDLRKIHEYLSEKNLRMAMWGDYLVEAVRSKGLQKRKTPDGWAYESPGALSPQQVKELVPKDILIFNWFWSAEEHGEANEATLDDFGFQQIYGNMDPALRNYAERSRRQTIIGGAPSCWSATTEFNLSKDLLGVIIGCSGMLWSGKVFDQRDLSELAQLRMPETHRRLSGAIAPSASDPVTPLDISASFSAPLRDAGFGVDLSAMRVGKVTNGRSQFDLAPPNPATGLGLIMAGVTGDQPNPLPREIKGIKIGEDATSLLFLHACARPSHNREAFRVIWDMDDTADLLGWYQVVYEDGLTESIPIRYGVNILEWDWSRQTHAPTYCYEAAAVECGNDLANPIRFFSFEWPNPRLGKVIEEIRLRGTKGFRGASADFVNTYGDVIPGNAILLKAISVVKKRV
jgi:Glycosyl hydrolase family 20, domain 2/Glycosyl hydrolase family 20, catalytic domain